MSTFYCECGFIAKECQYDEKNDGIHFSTPTFFHFSESLAERIDSYVKAKAIEQGSGWLKSFFGADYPEDGQFISIIEDIISAESNSVEFESTFRCPECGRLALGNRNGWVFYSQIHNQKD